MKLLYSRLQPSLTGQDTKLALSSLSEQMRHLKVSILTSLNTVQGSPRTTGFTPNFQEVKALNKRPHPQVNLLGHRAGQHLVWDADVRQIE